MTARQYLRELIGDGYRPARPDSELDAVDELIASHRMQREIIHTSQQRFLDAPKWKLWVARKMGIRIG